MALLQTYTGYEPNVSISTANGEMNTSGARFVAMVDLTHDDDDTNSHMSNIPLELPASANMSSNSSALVTFSQAGSAFVQNVHSLQPQIRLVRILGYDSILLHTPKVYL